MSARRIILFLVLLSISDLAAPGYCGDILSQRKLVLSKAITLARGIQPLATNEFIDIGSSLGNSSPDQREAAETLFKRVRKVAAHTHSAFEYADTSRAANSILKGLDQAAPQLSFRLFESWPTRPDLGDEYNKFKKKFEADRQRNRLVDHPMDYLKEDIPVDNTNAWMAVIWKLQGSQPDDARDAFERVLGECERQRGTFIATPHAISTFLNVNLWDAPLFVRYLKLLNRFPIRMSYELSCDDQSVTLDYAEGEALRVILRAMQNQRDLAARLLDAIPSLKQDTEQVGGLEAIWERGQLREKTAHGNSPILFRGYKDVDAQLDNLCGQFRVSPEKVRQTLAGLQSAETFELLCRAATSKCQPVADIASNLGREMTLNEPDPQIRISMALKLLPYYFDDTRLDAKWIDYGFEILGRGGTRTASLDRSEFEDRFVSQVALIDFSSAMAYIDSLKEPLSRLQLLLAVVHTLDRELMSDRH